MIQKNSIDIVVTWVDGGDPLWQKEKKKYLGIPETDDRPERYRDWEILKYWFRGVEKCAPWAEKIHFVTWGHLPEWLNTECSRLNIVRHEDFIPAEYLPTFNSHTIEFNMHRIKGLSERFLYLNDDMFFLQETSEEDFFVGNLPKDMLAFQPVVANPKNPVMSHLYLNNALVLSKYFDKRQNVRKQPEKYFHIGYPPMYFFYNMLELAFPKFTGFYTVHGPFPFLKSSFEMVWEREEQLLEETCRHKFRSKDDVSPYLIREWKKLLGEFSPSNPAKNFKYFDIDNSNKKLLETIRGRTAKTICINDANEEIEFERVSREIRSEFEKIFPEKSSFEK